MEKGISVGSSRTQNSHCSFYFVYDATMIDYRSSSLHFDIPQRRTPGSIENLHPDNVNWPSCTKSRGAQI
jgi:hypothetical protein